MASGNVRLVQLRQKRVRMRQDWVRMASGVKVSQQVKNSQLGELSFFTVQIH